jgi:hypothetical protein
MSEYATMAVSASYWTKNPELRFVRRDGKLILQYLESRHYTDRIEGVWLDVPVAEEETKE